MAFPRATGPTSALAALLLAAPAGAQQVDERSTAFVEAFRTACVPQRLSFEGTAEQARVEGWTAVEDEDHAELAAVLAKSEEGMREAEDEGLEIDFRYEAFARPHGEGRLHLVVSLAASDYLDEVGCYLYDFEATAPIDPNAVTAMIGHPPVQSHADDTITANVWGPSEGMPRTLDTYLTYIPPGSPLVDQGGFDGTVLKFTTSAPEDDGE